MEEKTKVKEKQEDPDYVQQILNWALGTKYGQPEDGQQAQQEGAPQIGDTKEFPNGAIGVWDGEEWIAEEEEGT